MTPARRTKVIAHRGAWGEVPENTLAAFERAIAIGADMIEVDVRGTADGHLIAFHDARAAGARIARMRRAELNAADGSLPPLLSEVLELAGDRVPVNVELKERAIVGDAVALVRRFGVERCLVSSFLDRTIAQALALEPRLRVALLVGLAWPRAPLARMRRCGARELGLQAPLASASLLRRLLEHRTPCFVWTVNDRRAIDRFLREPALSALVTDVPALALERRALLSGRTGSAAPR